MCFSATASFTLSAALVPAGLMCLRQASKLGTNWTALAVYPLAFAIQQASEGVVWLGLSQSDPQLANMGALGFLFFSHFFWLVWVPLSVYMLHRGDDTRAQALLMMLMLGTAFAVTLSAPVWAMDGYIPLDISSGSVSYLLPLMLEGDTARMGMKVLYASIIAGSLLLSSYKSIQAFGIVILASLVIAQVWFSNAFISVWCYFAAGLSLYLMVALGLEARHKATTIKPQSRLGYR